MKTKLLIPLLFTYNLLNAQGLWTQKADFPGTPREYAKGFSIGSKGYVATGDIFVQGPGSTYYKDFWEWDQLTNSWVQKSDFGGAARSGSIGFSIANKGYIGTGYGGTSVGFLKDFWEWDQSTNTWTQKASLTGVARAGAIGFSIADKGYIGTGAYKDNYGNFQYKNDLWEWDSSTNTWTQKAPLVGQTRTASVSFSIGNKGYLGLGYIGTLQNGLVTDFWEWDQSLNSWTQKADFPGPARESATSFTIGSKGYVGTGTVRNGSGILVASNDFWEWDQATNTWSQKENYGGGNITGSVGFSINNLGYIVTGNTKPDYSDNFYKGFWEYNPTVTSVRDYEIDNSLSVFPNPFSSIATIKSHGGFRNASLTLYNSVGKQLKQIRDISGQQIILNRDSYSSGIYYIKICDGEKTYVEKIIIK